MDNYQPLERVLAYARGGLTLFPVNPSPEPGLRKSPLVSQYKATSDPDVLTAWWQRWPGALIGCRIALALLIFDVDPRYGGDRAWEALEDEFDPIRVGRMHYSGRGDGGFHAWFPWPEGLAKVTGKRLHEWAREHEVGAPAPEGRWTSGIDLLHHNWRYTILPPSPHPDTGNPYRWREHNGELEPVPEFLVELVTPLNGQPVEEDDKVVAAEDQRESIPLRVLEHGDDSIADWVSSAWTWPQILEPHGWKAVQGDGNSDGSLWRHPEATNDHSASVKHGCLFVYSPNTALEETEEGDPHGYTRFRAWAELEHGGDMRAAAREARSRRTAGEGASESATAQPTPVLLPPPTNPMAVARKLLQPLYDPGTDALTLRHWRGGWMCWEGPAWMEVEDRAVRAEAYEKVEHAVYADGSKLKEWAPNRHKLADLLDAMAAVALLPSRVQPPSWVDTTGPTQVISCANGLLDVPSRNCLPHDPRYFTLTSVPFDYDPEPGEPVEWLRFLDSVWGDEREAALQEWFGYVISGRLDLDKALLLFGPPRAGKRIIASVLSALIGKGNVAGITLARLSEQFGLADLIHKPLAIIPDARVGRDSRVVVERLLAITGEDLLNIERKYREDWVGQLPTRLMMLTNELPNFRDASGALANRFLILELTESWLGREDGGLLGRLMGELPAILVWALDGLERLNYRGRFSEPQTSREALTALIDIASPVAAFVRERCDRDPLAEDPCDTVRAAWRVWAEENGHRVGSSQSFGRELRAVIPGLKRYRPRSPDGSERAYHYRGLRLRR